MILTEPEKAFWKENGFLVLGGFFEPSEVEAVERSLHRVQVEKPRSVTVDDLVTGERLRASDADFSHLMKVNDLYLYDQRIIEVALSERVGGLLRTLLDESPVLCNSLNLQKGSQQPSHVDTLYMTPTSDDKLVATWMALEDVHCDAGPLRYFPGSNHITPFRFSDQSLHVKSDEFTHWTEYMDAEVDRRGLQETTFLASKGDLLIWHARLFHGGSPIEDRGRTRNSLVTHFYCRSDCERAGYRIDAAPGGHWVVRPPQPVPSREPLVGIDAELAEQAADERLVTTVRSAFGSARSTFAARVGRR